MKCKLLTLDKTLERPYASTFTPNFIHDHACLMGFKFEHLGLVGKPIMEAFSLFQSNQ